MSGEAASRAHEIQREFSNTWTHDVRDLARPSTESVLRTIIGQSPKEMVPRLENEFFGQGPLAPLLADESITEIVVNGDKEIWFEKMGQFHRLPDRFLTPTTFKNFVDRLASEIGAAFDLAHPFADGRWGDFRVHLACAPLTHCPFHLTLRRFPKNPWTLEKLLAAGWASSDALNLLRDEIERRANVLFIGPTGSGKTSVLGSCLKHLAQQERVVIIEDTEELPLPNSASTKMLTRLSPPPALCEVTLGDLVKQSLRMRPSRLALGEVRGGEAKDLLLALATGHSGSFGTLHASDAKQALLRLEMLVQMGAPQWHQQAIRQLIHLSVNTIVSCGMKNGHRFLHGIHRVAALESFGFLLEQIV